MPHADTPAPRASILIACHRHVDLLVNCLESLRGAARPALPSETIVVFNGTPEADRHRIRKALREVQVLVSQVNLGFGPANNLAARRARGEYLVFLNDDAVVESDWLQALVTTADEHPEAGAVGGKILLADGRLQEAGSLIWSDGSTLGVGRNLPPGLRRYDHLRQVDYVSAASLLVRRRLFEEIGGFDERFFPGYNEDVDLCLAILRRRARILYQPRSVIWHRESQTSADDRTFLVLRTRPLLRQKWPDQLQLRAEPAPHSQTAISLAVHRAQGSPRRVLVIDDRIPDAGAGSGFGRMLDGLRDLSGAGYAVSLFTSDRADGDRSELQDLGVEVVEGDLPAHLRSTLPPYDACVISRPHNLKLLTHIRRRQPGCAVIYDAEALFHRRLEREAALAEHDDARAALSFEAEQARRLERRVVTQVDRVVSVSEVEADFFRATPGACPVEVLDVRTPEARLTPASFADRRGMVFVAGWLAPYPSPNSDGLEWFVAHVLPLIRAEIPWAQLLVTGAAPPPEVRRLAGAGVRFLGHVEDLGALFDRVRVAVVPVRYGAGIKVKAVSALEHGVPGVATTTGAEGIDGAGGDALAVADTAEEFAQRVVALLDDPRAWRRARAAIEQITGRWASTARRRWPDVVQTAILEKSVERVGV